MEIAGPSLEKMDFTIADTETLSSSEKDYLAETNYVFSDKNLAALGEQLKSSGGRALFVVHPFFEVGTAQWSGYMDSVLNDRDSEMRKYWEELAVLMENMQANGIPVVVLQEIHYLSAHTLEDSETIEAVYEGMKDNLNKISNGRVDADKVFTMFTPRGEPHPLRHKTEVELTSREVIKSRMDKLKAAGLKVGLIAGLKFAPGEGDNFEYYASAQEPFTSFSERGYKQSYGDWKLADYYKDKPNHPLSKIRPDKCVGEFVRMLAFNEIKPGITSTTYPQKLGKSSDYEPKLYKSRYASEGEEEKEVFEQKP